MATVDLAGVGSDGCFDNQILKASRGLVSESPQNALISAIAEEATFESDQRKLMYERDGQPLARNSSWSATVFVSTHIVC